ncbi:MAG: hypothetical protein AAFR04_08610 [Pseudomonadota bacterium]
MDTGAGTMADSPYSISADDDLPRTFRRAREEQARARNEDAFAMSAVDEPTAPLTPPEATGHDVPAGVVTSIKVPFFSLMMFFIKAVLAAIPALILLGALLWGAGQLLTTYFPWLLKAKILIQFV